MASISSTWIKNTKKTHCYLKKKVHSKTYNLKEKKKKNLKPFSKKTIQRKIANQDQKIKTTWKMKKKNHILHGWIYYIGDSITFKELSWEEKPGQCWLLSSSHFLLFYFFLPTSDSVFFGFFNISAMVQSQKPQACLYQFGNVWCNTMKRNPVSSCGRRPGREKMYSTVLPCNDSSENFVPPKRFENTFLGYKSFWGTYLITVLCYFIML